MPVDGNNWLSLARSDLRAGGCVLSSSDIGEIHSIINFAMQSSASWNVIDERQAWAIIFHHHRPLLSATLLPAQPATA